MTEAQRELELKELGKKVADLERKLGGIIGGQPTIREKCPKMPTEAWNIVKELRGLDEQYKLVVKAKLDELLTGPDDTKADPTLFYEGKHSDEFTRTTEWFKIMGFRMFRYSYTFTNRWDKDDIKVTFLVPNTLKSKDVAHIMWHFHGGGFVRFFSSESPSF
jgi:hypothetical protein